MPKARASTQKKTGPKGRINYQRAVDHIDDAMWHLRDVLSMTVLRTENGEVVIRLTSQTANRFYFWRKLTDEERPAGYPDGKTSLLGEIDGTTDKFLCRDHVVRRIIGLSRVRRGGENDPWSSTLQDNLYALGIAVTLVINAKHMLKPRGVDELVRFLKAALMLEPDDESAREFITLSGVFDPTPAIA